MFICTLKASNIRFFALVISAVALLITLVAITQENVKGEQVAITQENAEGAQVAIPQENVNGEQVAIPQENVNGEQVAIPHENVKGEQVAIPHENADASLSASAAPNAAKISFENVRSNDDRVAFLRQFGWEVESDPISEAKLKLPAEFDDIMSEYNEIQRSQGLDLSKYKGNEVERYSYAVTNYPGYDGEVVANVIVAKGRVVAGDVCSADPDGFIGSLYRPDAGAETGESGEAADASAPSATGSDSAARDEESAEKEAAASEAQIAPADAEAPWDGSPEIADAAYSG